MGLESITWYTLGSAHPTEAPKDERRLKGKPIHACDLTVKIIQSCVINWEQLVTVQLLDLTGVSYKVSNTHQMLSWTLNKPSEDKTGKKYFFLSSPIVSSYYHFSSLVKMHSNIPAFSNMIRNDFHQVMKWSQSSQSHFKAFFQLAIGKILYLNGSHWKLMTLAKPWRGLISAFGVQMAKAPAKTHNSPAQQHCWWKDT